MGSKTAEIVIGIDFGTTHSGASWAINGGNKIIRLIDNWPDLNSSILTREKVPSVISYLNGKPRQWGYEVALTDESFKWIKILLEENHKYVTTVEPVQNASNLLRQVDKTATEVVADYLKLLWEYTQDDIRRYHPTFEKIYNLRVVLTVPAIWSPIAREKTKEAARLAGMPEPLTLVTEPEAAALATLRGKSEENSLEVGDAFIVCDAGGGTVDLISYQVESLQPLRIKECAIGNGDLCGSVFVDAAFEEHIATLVGEKVFNNIKERHRKKMMASFEHGIKRSFSEKRDMNYSVELIGVPNDPQNGIIDETIVLSKNHILGFFNKVAGQIEKLIADQIAEVSDKGLRVKSILLVGGFGSSPYLHERLRQSHRNDGIQVMQVNQAWSSVCRGATMWGLEHPAIQEAITPALITQDRIPINPTTITSRLSRFSYGLAFNHPYDPSMHNPKDVYQDPDTQKFMVRNQMTWLLKRGQEVEEGKVLHTDCSALVDTRFWDSGLEWFKTTLYSNDEANPPSRRTDKVKTLCEVAFAADRGKLWLEKSFKTPAGKRRHAPMVMAIVLGSASLDFVVVYRGEILAAVETKYAE